MGLGHCCDTFSSIFPSITHDQLSYPNRDMGKVLRYEYGGLQEGTSRDKTCH